MNIRLCTLLRMNIKFYRDYIQSLMSESERVRERERKTEGFNFDHIKSERRVINNSCTRQGNKVQDPVLDPLCLAFVFREL